MHGLGALLRSCPLGHLQSQNLRFSCRKNASVVTSDMTASAMRSVRKRNVVVLNGRFRPKRSKNGLYHSHTARNGAGNSTGVAPRHPGSLFRPPAHLLAKPRFSPFCLIWGLSLGVSLFAHRARVTAPCAPAGACRPRGATTPARAALRRAEARGPVGSQAATAAAAAARLVAGVQQLPLPLWAM